MPLARVIRADSVLEGDTDFAGNPIVVMNIEEHEDQVALAEEQANVFHLDEDKQPVQGAHPNEIAGSAPQMVTLSVDGELIELSPSDLIVVMR